MASATRTLLAALLAVLALADYVDGALFSYKPIDVNDPANKDLVRQALTLIGINSEDLHQLKTLHSKWRVLGYSYKGTYVNLEGKTCTFNFEWKHIHGLRVYDKPHCSPAAQWRMRWL